MAFHYSKRVVLATYRQYKPGTNNPNFSTLNNWDEGLFDDYDSALEEYLAQYGIPAENKSEVLLLAKLSNGATVEKQIDNACKYYVNTKDIELA
ncbi:MAG TPA: hypothetical protein VM095_18615 [Pyrinomonadaceae bacterium]|nr:hypothetical protein [Pyrinomonadaceae bacterium]